MSNRSLLLLGAISAVGLLAAAPAAIGPYTIDSSPAGIEVHARDDGRAGSVLLAAGLGLALIGALRARNASNERRNFALARVVMGLGLAGMGGFAMLGSAKTWTASRDGIIERTRGGMEARSERAQIEAVTITRRRDTGADQKNEAGSRPWIVQAGSAVFSVASESDAQQLATALARAIGVEVRTQ